MYVYMRNPTSNLIYTHLHDYGCVLSIFGSGYKTTKITNFKIISPNKTEVNKKTSINKRLGVCLAFVLFKDVFLYVFVLRLWIKTMSAWWKREERIVEVVLNARHSLLSRLHHIQSLMSVIWKPIINGFQWNKQYLVPALQMWNRNAHKINMWT